MDAEQVAVVEKEAAARLESATTMDELRAAEGEVLGKRSSLAQLSQGLRDLDADGRREMGQLVHEARTRLQALHDERTAALAGAERQARIDADRLDLTEIPPGPPSRGRLNLVQQTRAELEDVFVGMGYTVEEGPEVETDWNNFEALNFPKGHPARSGFDTLYLDWGGPESTLLRPHTSPVQVRTMLAQKPPIYMVCPGKTYRKDTPDARHNSSFSQIEGLVVDRGITFGDLAGTIETFTHAFFGQQINARLRPAYFPFTEPSAEFEITCTICLGAGCRTCSDTGWIELGGCGMVHPNVFSAVGIDNEVWTGFAFGFGIDRLAQMRHTLPDMRTLLDNDIRFISQF